MDLSRVDPKIWEKRVNDPSVEGLNKLLLLDRLVTEEPDFGDARHFFVTDIDTAIHGGESWCRVCHMSQEDHTPDSRGPNLAKYDVTSSVSWEREGQVFQDLEESTVVKRQLDDVSRLTRPWEGDVYTADGTSTTAFSNLTQTAGVFTPFCYCGLPCGLRIVKKAGFNHGRRFFTCGQRSGHNVQYCGFFAWMEALQASEAVAPTPVSPLPTKQQGHLAVSEVEDSPSQLLAVGRLFKAGAINVSQRGLLKDLVLNQTSDRPLPPDVRDALIAALQAGTDADQLRLAAAKLPSSI